MFLRILQPRLRKAYSLLAGSYSRLGVPDQALEVSRRGVGLYPEDFELLFLKGTLAQRQGLVDEAERAYRLVMGAGEVRYFASSDSGIKAYKARHNLARLYLDCHRHSDAAEHWEALLRENARYTPAWEGLIETLVVQGRYNDALLAAGRMAESLGDDDGPLHRELLCIQIALAQNDTADARARLEALALAHADHPEVKQAWAKFAFEHGSPEEAEKSLLALQQLNPRDAALHHNLAIVYLRLGRLDDARTQANASLKLRPNYRPTQELLAAAERVSGCGQAESHPDR